MILGLAGVTGTGKSFFKDKITEQLGFEKLKIVTNREIRIGEKNGEDKIFVNDDELNELRKQGKIGFEFNLVGSTYAYLKEELFSNKNIVFEMHYRTIFDFKKACPKLHTIYIFPNDVEVAKQKTRERHLKPDVEKKRILEIDEHYKNITTDENLRRQFDYYIYNNFDKKSEKEMLDLVKDITKVYKGENK